MGKASLPNTLAHFVAPHVGRVVEAEDVSHAFGNAVTFRVRGSTRTAILKSYRSPRTFGQELRAYREWAPRVPDTPVLLDHRHERPLALLLEALPGVPLSSARLTVADERRLHGRAGSWLRALHDVSFLDRDPISLEEAYRKRMLAWNPAPNGMDPALRDWIRTRLDALPRRVRGGTRVPCHLDFEPRNWLVDAEGRWVAVIDFEHARPDHPLADLARLAAYAWPARPDLADAFLAAYGGSTRTVDLETVDLLAVFEAAHRLTWALRRGDAKLVQDAREALAARGAPVRS